MSEEIIDKSLPGELIKFMDEMNSWEAEFFNKRKQLVSEGVEDPEISSSYSKRLERIFDEYVVKDKTNYGRLIDLGCTKPETYDPKTDKFDLLSGGEKNLLIQLQQVNGAETISRIYMVKKSGKWLIKKKEIFGFDDKWHRSPL